MGTMIKGQPDSWQKIEGSGGARDHMRWQNLRGKDQLEKDIQSLGAAHQKAIKDFNKNNPQASPQQQRTFFQGLSNMFSDPLGGNQNNDGLDPNGANGSRTGGLSQAEQDKLAADVDQRRQAGEVPNLPSDYKETELKAGREAEASRPGAGLPVSGGGNQSPGERSGQPQDPKTGNEGLTDMQIWAKTHPGLAAKVKPGQAGSN